MIENTANLPMKNTDLSVGVLTPPNSFYKPVLYSDQEVNDSFKRMNAEVAPKTNSAKHGQKTPLLIKLIYIAGGSVAAFFGGKKMYAFFKK